MSCYLMGMLTPCSLVGSILGMGGGDAATVCPGGDCTGIRTGSNGRFQIWVPPFATGVTGENGNFSMSITTGYWTDYVASAIPSSALGPSSVAASNLSWVQNALNYVKNHPVFVSVNEILAAQITYQHSTKTLCANVGLGASVLPSKAITVGVYNDGKMSKWTDVLSSWGYSFGANLFAGYAMSTNSSGTIGGPSASPGVGLSGSYTWGACGPAPW